MREYLLTTLYLYMYEAPAVKNCIIYSKICILELLSTLNRSTGKNSKFLSLFLSFDFDANGQKFTFPANLWT